MNNKLFSNSFFDVDKVIDGNRYDFFSLIIGLFIIIPLTVLLHELTNGFGIGQTSFKEFANMSDGPVIFLYIRNAVIFGVMVFFTIKSYISKEKKYIFVNKQKLITKWLFIAIPIILSIILIFNNNFLQPFASLIIAILMMFIYYSFLELILMKVMKAEKID